jgi:hypothetical protein
MSSSLDDIRRHLDTCCPLDTPGAILSVHSIHTSHLGAAALNTSATGQTSHMSRAASPAAARVLDVARMENALRQLYSDKLRATVQAVIHALSTELPLDHVFVQLMQDAHTANFCKIRLGEVVETFLFSVQAHQYHTLASELARREMEVVQLVGQVDELQQQLSAALSQAGASPSCTHLPRDAAADDMPAALPAGCYVDKATHCELLKWADPKVSPRPVRPSASALVARGKLASARSVGTATDLVPLRSAAAQCVASTAAVGSMTNVPVLRDSCTDTDPLVSAESKKEASIAAAHLRWERSTETERPIAVVDASTETRFTAAPEMQRTAVVDASTETRFTAAPEMQRTAVVDASTETRFTAAPEMQRTAVVDASTETRFTAAREMQRTASTVLQSMLLVDERALLPKKTSVEAHMRSEAVGASQRPTIQSRDPQLPLSMSRPAPSIFDSPRTVTHDLLTEAPPDLTSSLPHETDVRIADAAVNGAVQRLREAAQEQMQRIEDLLRSRFPGVDASTQPWSESLLESANLALKEMEVSLAQLTTDFRRSLVDKGAHSAATVDAIHSVSGDLGSRILDLSSAVARMEQTQRSGAAAQQEMLAAIAVELKDSVSGVQQSFAAFDERAANLASSFQAGCTAIAANVAAVMRADTVSLKDLLSLLCAVAETGLRHEPNKEQLLCSLNAHARRAADAADAEKAATETFQREAAVARAEVEMMQHRLAVQLDEGRELSFLVAQSLLQLATLSRAGDLSRCRSQALADAEETLLGDAMSATVSNAAARAFASTAVPIMRETVEQVRACVRQACDDTMYVSEARTLSSALEDRARATEAEEKLRAISSLVAPFVAHTDGDDSVTRNVADVVNQLDRMTAARREAAKAAAITRSVLLAERSVHRNQLRQLLEAVRAMQVHCTGLRQSTGQSIQQFADKFSVMQTRILLELDHRSAMAADKFMDFLRSTLATLRPAVPSSDPTSPMLINRLLSIDSRSDGTPPSYKTETSTADLESWLRGMLQALHSTVSGIQAERAERSAECSLVVTANGELQSRLWAAERREEELSTEIRLLKDAALDDKSQLAAVREDLASSKAAHDASTARLAASLASTSAALSEKDRSIADLRTANAALHAELSRVAERSNAVENEVEALRECTANASGDLHAAVAKLARADKSSILLADERERLMQRLQAVTHQLRKEELRNAALHERCLVKEAENARLSVAARSRSVAGPMLADSVSRSSVAVTDQSPRGFFSSALLPKGLADSSSSDDSACRTADEGLSPSPQMPHVSSPIAA